jgi:hypothetical protein
MPKLGQKVDMSRAQKGAPPVVFAVQPNSFFPVETPDDIKQWEEDVRNFFGIEAKAGGIHAASESCSAGCSDDCDLCQR